jgi:hypothetical protein
MIVAGSIFDMQNRPRLDAVIGDISNAGEGSLALLLHYGHVDLDVSYLSSVGIGISVILAIDSFSELVTDYAIDQQYHIELYRLYCIVRHAALTRQLMCETLVADWVFGVAADLCDGFRRCRITDVMLLMMDTGTITTLAPLLNIKVAKILKDLRKDFAMHTEGMTPFAVVV